MAAAAEALYVCLQSTLISIYLYSSRTFHKQKYTFIQLPTPFAGEIVSTLSVRIKLLNLT